MKYYNKLMGAAIVMMSVTGCSKFLDKPQENTNDATGIDYKDITSMYSPVSGVYRTTAGNNPGLINWMDFGIRGVRGDDLEKGSSPSDQSTLTDIKNFKNNFASVQTFWGSNNSWNDYYGLAINCNSALQELDKFKANIAASNTAALQLYNQYYSEVRFFRAFAHLMASRVFGAVPILTNNNTLSTVSKSSVDSIRMFIVKEMSESANYMEDAAPANASHVGAVTKYSAWLLEAKAAADLAKSDNGSAYWDTVLNATNRIINSNKFVLYPDFYQSFKKPGKMSTESLYEIQFTDFGSSTGTPITPDAFWSFQGPSGNQHGSPINGWGFMTPTQSIKDFLAARNDSVRAKTTFLYCGNSASTYVTTPSGDNIYGNTNGYTAFIGKAYFPSSQMTSTSQSYGTNNNIRVLRYSDVLLLNAEAKIRKGQNGDVPLNLVRQRAKLNPIVGATLQNVLDERRAEFACEWWGERYNDLIRTGTAATVLAANGFVAGTSEYLPIPQAQIDLNQNLK